MEPPLTVSNEAEVLEANERFYAALESLDIGLMSQVWLHEDWVKCIHPGWGLIVGWNHVQESWENIFRHTSEIRVRLSHVTVKVEGSMAWVCCVENISNRFTEGIETAQAVGTNVFFFHEGRWLLILHHASLAPPANVQPSAPTIQ